MFKNSKFRLWLKAVTEPKSAKPLEWVRTESMDKDGNACFFDTGGGLAM